MDSYTFVELMCNVSSTVSENTFFQLFLYGAIDCQDWVVSFIIISGFSF